MSPIFQNLFEDVLEAVEAILNWDEIAFCRDFGVITFVTIYANKIKTVRNYISPSDELGMF